MKSLWNLMWGVMTRNNTSSSGWEWLRFKSCGCH